ncbi:MAG: hypothetical protein A2508_01055 [Candidatus Lambdaproteobacteria bacterium RIFOXYD12_FULL_49_8]|nr:MAG: hypothetical protein A2508_01055 [Candidatus Lambdaproteobacteria bacterium RIFOXYD12_FULL_49_8]
MPVDRWLLAANAKCVEQVTDFFEKYDYSNALRTVERFFWDSYCDNYLEMIKFRLWENPEQEKSYSDAQIQAGKAVAVEVLYSIVKLLAPVIPFVTEHLYQGFFKDQIEGEPVSIHIASWPKPSHEGWNQAQLKDGERVSEILSLIRKQKIEQKIGIATKVAQVTLNAPAEVLGACQDFQSEIASAVRAMELVLVEGPSLLCEVKGLE